MQEFHTSHGRAGFSQLFSALAKRGVLTLLTCGLFVTLAACGNAEKTPRITRKALSDSQAIATDFLRTELVLSPELANRLGLEDYADRQSSSRFDNHAQGGFERGRLIRIELLQRLRARPLLPLSHTHARDLGIAETALLNLITLEQLGHGRFSYDDLRPYAIDPVSGVWTEGPQILAFRQRINSAAEARAYVSRLQALSGALDDTKRRLIADQAADLTLPKLLAVETRRRVDRMFNGDPETFQRLTGTFEALTFDLEDFGSAEQSAYLRLVEMEITDKLRPAYLDLAETLDEIAQNAPEQISVLAQPEGYKLYTLLLQAATGDEVNPEGLHDRHLARVETLRTDLVGLMEWPEETEIPARLREKLTFFDAPVLAETDGEAAIDPAPTLGNGRRRLFPSQETLLQAVTRLEDRPALSAAAADWAETLQGAPYRDWLEALGRDSLAVRQLIEYPAIKAGWSHYAYSNMTGFEGAAAEETLAQAHIKLLQAVLAATDTGIHLQRWTAAEAMTFLRVEAGLSEPAAREVVLRITARPAYYSAVMASYYRFETLSERSQAILGQTYDETAFRKALIGPGPRSLVRIETDIESWYDQALTQQAE